MYLYVCYVCMYVWQIFGRYVWGGGRGVAGQERPVFLHRQRQPCGQQTLAAGETHTYIHAYEGWLPLV